MSFYTSLSGLKAAQTDLGVTANNIANVGSMGFKRSRAEFGDIKPPSSTTPGIGTRLKGITQQFTQGNFEASSRELDLAINGAGFFVTRNQSAGGDTYLTRNGSLQIDSNRYLLDSNRNFVQVLPVDASGNLTATDLASATSLQLPTANTAGSALSSIDIGKDGVITATYADGTTEPIAGVMVANVSNPEGLAQQGNARWSITGESGTITSAEPGTSGLGTVESGVLERANVDITEELVGLITAQRNFQANAKAIETANAITQTVTNMRT
ncbi:MAG TPA: flagellar hook-basal body complex protein [Allosphingosinicella sp.]